MRIALLEDETELAALVHAWLHQAGHECSTFGTGREFMDGVRNAHFDLFILDWMLPDIQGDAVLDWIRQRVGWQVPVLFATARDSEEDIVAMLKRGADDYLVKPLSQPVLLARVEAAARRARGAQPAPRALFGPYEVDTNDRTILHHGARIELTQKEFDLALFLFQNPGRLLSRDHVLESVWGKNPLINTRTVDTHVSRIRKKLDLTTESGWRLTPVYGYGYRLEVVEPRAETGS